MHTLQFDTHTEQTLNQLAMLAGKNPDEFIKGVVLEFLAEESVIKQANAAYSSYVAGQEKTAPLNEMECRCNARCDLEP